MEFHPAESSYSADGSRTETKICSPMINVRGWPEDQMKIAS